MEDEQIFEHLFFRPLLAKDSKKLSRLGLGYTLSALEQNILLLEDR